MGKPGKIKVGTIVGDKYRILRPLEKGGMGTVYEAVHTGLDRNVAIKILHPSLTENKRLVSRFVQEAKMIAMVHHRNIVDVLDVGYTVESVPFFVMEFLNGENLKVRMSRKAALSIREILGYMRDTLSGLAFAHNKGIVHRDMKPGNIFLASEPDGSTVAKILDFGISKLLSQGDVEKKPGEGTMAGAFLGTPAYMSPEQARGNFEDVDQRSDIYSCGIIMYKMLTGTVPFKGETFVEVLHNVIHASVPPPSRIRESIPHAIDDLVVKAIAKNPGERYQDCQAFIGAIDGLLSTSDEKSFAAGDGGPRDAPKPPGGRENMEISVTAEGECSLADGLSTSHSFDSTPVGEAGQQALSIPPADGKQKKTWSMTGGEEPLPPSPWKRRLTWIIPVAIAVIAVPVVIVAVGVGNGGKSVMEETIGNSPPADAAAADPAPDATPTVPEPPKTVSVTFAGFPAGSEFFLDGSPRRTNPIVLDYGEKPAIILVTKGGKELLRRTITPLKDIELFYTAAGGKETEEDEMTDGEAKSKGKKKKKKKGDGDKPGIIKKPVF
jgi:serine/threonine protein kinase